MEPDLFIARNVIENIGLHEVIEDITFNITRLCIFLLVRLFSTCFSVGVVIFFIKIVLEKIKSIPYRDETFAGNFEETKSQIIYSTNTHLPSPSNSFTDTSPN